MQGLCKRAGIDQRKYFGDGAEFEFNFLRLIQALWLNLSRASRNEGVGAIGKACRVGGQNGKRL